MEKSLPIEFSYDDLALWGKAVIEEVLLKAGLQPFLGKETPLGEPRSVLMDFTITADVSAHVLRLICQQVDGSVISIDIPMCVSGFARES